MPAGADDRDPQRRDPRLRGKRHHGLGRGCDPASASWRRRQATSILPGPAPSTVRPCDDRINDAACQAEVAEYLDKRNSDSLRGDYTETGSNVFFQHASTLYHPTAGCLSDSEIALQQELFPEDGPRCNFIPSASGAVISRDYDAEFLAGTAQIFQNELAAVSWNFAMGLVVTSACTDEKGRKSDPECFDAEHPWVLNKCSFNQPQFCKKVKEFFDLGGRSAQYSAGGWERPIRAPHLPVAQRKRSGC